MNKEELVTCSCCNHTASIEWWVTYEYNPKEWGCVGDFINWIKS